MQALPRASARSPSAVFETFTNGLAFELKCSGSKQTAFYPGRPVARGANGRLALAQPCRVRTRGFSRGSPFGWDSYGSRARTGRCYSVRSEEPEVFQGRFGPWKVEQTDRLEVLAYRAGLVLASLSLVTSASAAFLPADSPLSDFIRSNLDALYALGSISLGSSLFLIHIYVTPIKRTLQSLWLLGSAGSLAVWFLLAAPAGQTLANHVLANPAEVWAIGPLFAALTGLAFKEGLCYGKLEAALLVFVIPSLLLGHLSGLAGEGAEKSLLATWALLMAVFAARKFTQPIKDDIGDKSVFIFQALPEEEQAKLLDKLSLTMRDEQ